MGDFDLENNTTFNNLVDRDLTAEVIGYVSEIYGTSIVGRVTKYKLFKFVLTNGSTDDNKKVMVLIWDESLIEKYSSSIRLNEIVHLDGVHVKSAILSNSRTNADFIAFDLSIQKSTKVDFYGIHRAPATLGLPQQEKPQEVNFENAMDATGPIILKGYVKTTFVTVSSKFDNGSYGSGAVGDGEFKISVHINNYTPIAFTKGTPVLLIGEIKKNVPCTIVCSDSSCIRKDDEREPILPIILINGNKTPKRTTRPE